MLVSGTPLPADASGACGREVPGITLMPTSSTTAPVFTQSALQKLPQNVKDKSQATDMQKAEPSRCTHDALPIQNDMKGVQWNRLQWHSWRMDATTLAVNHAPNQFRVSNGHHKNVCSAGERGKVKVFAVIVVHSCGYQGRQALERAVAADASPPVVRDHKDIMRNAALGLNLGINDVDVQLLEYGGEEVQQASAVGHLHPRIVASAAP
jgi:hypothetical protein